MLNIAICDDEIVFGYKLKSILQKYMDISNESYKIDVYNSGKEFVALGLKMVQYQIVFLDINMQGMETAYKIREWSEETYLVFVTAFTDYTLEGYKVKAFRYLLKYACNFNDSLTECLNSILAELKLVDKKITISFIERKCTFSIKRLQYVESNLHKLTFHIIEKEIVNYTLKESLNNMERELNDESLLRIHQSYLVNLRYIERLHGYNVILKGGERIPISKNRYSNVKKRILQYKGVISY